MVNQPLEERYGIYIIKHIVMWRTKLPLLLTPLFIFHIIVCLGCLLTQ